jgi:hypothetical protein
MEGTRTMPEPLRTFSFGGGVQSVAALVLAARVSRVCDFDANESAAPDDERWAIELDQLAEFARDLAHGTEGDAAIRSGPGDPVDVARLLSEGGSISLRYELSCDAGFFAAARDPDDDLIGTGYSRISPTDALAHIHLFRHGAGPYRLAPPF